MPILIWKKGSELAKRRLRIWGITGHGSMSNSSRFGRNMMAAVQKQEEWVSNSRQEILKNIFALMNYCFKSKKGMFFASYQNCELKIDTSYMQKIMRCVVNQSHQQQKPNDHHLKVAIVCLMESKSRCLFVAAQTWSNSYWGSLPTKIFAIKLGSRK